MVCLQKTLAAARAAERARARREGEATPRSGMQAAMAKPMAGGSTWTIKVALDKPRVVVAKDRPKTVAAITPRAREAKGWEARMSRSTKGTQMNRKPMSWPRRMTLAGVWAKAMGA